MLPSPPPPPQAARQRAHASAARKRGTADIRYEMGPPARPHLRLCNQSRFSRQVLRPCVAASRIRSLGRISRLVTSPFGSPGAEFVHVVVPAARRRAPKSVPGYRSPVTSSRTRSLTGRSPKLYDRSTHVDVPVAGLYVTSTM